MAIRGTPNKAEREWMDFIARQGCSICRSPAEVHHITKGGRRIDHLHSIPLCMMHLVVVWHSAEKERNNCYAWKMKDRGKDRHAKTEDRRVYQRSYQRSYAWKRKFGLSESEVMELVAQQDCRCAICLREFDMDATGYGRAEMFPHVDHDHDTGKVRGLLCNSCNVSIGRMGESVETLQRAIQYILRHKQAQPGR